MGETTLGPERPSEELLDKLGRPVRDLRISVTDRCNFRCVYCMPKEVFGPGYRFLKMKNLLSYEEMERLARIFAGLGVTKLRLTGGEPLVRRHIPCAPSASLQCADWTLIPRSPRAGSLAFAECGRRSAGRCRRGCAPASA